MSKALKSVGRAVKKAAKWVKKNVGTILLVAALVYTGGAALGFFQGAATAGGGATGLAGIKAAWGGLLGTGATAGSAGAATTGTSAATTTAATTGAASGAGLIAPTAIESAAATNAAAIKAAAATTGKYLAAGTALQAGGAYMQAKSAEDAAEEERARQDAKEAEYNRGMYAYGINRVGDRDGNYAGGDWDKVMAPAPGGLMAPKPVAPQTIDELIRARQQGLA